MKVTPDDYGRRCQFDHFCKLVLYHEAVDYFRERKHQRKCRVRNRQQNGDVTGLVDRSNQVVVRYQYNSWGKVT